MESESSTPPVKLASSLEAARKKRRPKTTWVSVDESLPPEFELVLIHWGETDEEGTEYAITLGGVTHKGVWVTSGGEAIETAPQLFVTHWAYVNDPSGNLHEV